MSTPSILTPLFKKIDKFFFGIEEIDEIEKIEDLGPSTNDAEFEITESTN